MYNTIRDTLKTGDIVLWKGKSLISRIILLWTKFSHASLVLKMENCDAFMQHRLLIEALPEGVSLRLLSKKIKEYKGSVYIYRLKEISDDQKKFIRDVAIVKLLLGTGYDFKGLIANMFGRVHLDAKRYFCSEFVYDVLTTAGVKMKKKEKFAPRPGDLPDIFDGELIKIK